MYKRMLTAVTAAMIAVYVLFFLGPMGVEAMLGPRHHIVAHVR